MTKREWANFCVDRLIREGRHMEGEREQLMAQYMAVEVDLDTLPDPVPSIYEAWYAENPDLVPRVREYAAILAGLDLSSDATTDQIAAAIQNSQMADAEKVAMILRAQTAFNNVVLNLEYLGISKPQYTAWAEMPQLIGHLPPLETEANHGAN